MPGLTNKVSTVSATTANESEALGLAPTTAPSPGAAAAEGQTEATPSVRAHLRGNKITVTIPDEILAPSDLTGRTTAEIFADLLAAQVAGIRAKAKSLLGEVAL
jgi:hypothetical protein